MSADGLPDFFISYTQADRAHAEWIAWELEEAGYRAIVQAWDFLPGGNFVERMQFATAKAERTIPVLSPEFLASRFVLSEWAAAFARDPNGQQKLLLPVRIKECELEGLLSQLIYVDFVGADEATARERLLAAAEGQRLKPTTKPAFPKSNVSKPRFPGTLPPIWNVPFRQNPNFTGREEHLQALRTDLTSGQRAAIVQAIHGTGGAGKTALAVEYAYRHLDEYQAVCWIEAETASTLNSGSIALARLLGVETQDPAELALAVRNWFDQRTGWLLVFDNADPAVGLGDLLPQGRGGHVLITSRNPNWSHIAAPVRVGVWPRSEAVDTRRTHEGFCRG